MLQLEMEAVPKRSPEMVIFLAMYGFIRLPHVKSFVSRGVVMPRAKGERISERRKNLTDYGIWFWRIADKLEVDDTIIAARSKEISPENKISQGTISKSTRFAVAGEEVLNPTLSTTQKIFSTFELIAQEQGKQIPHEVKKLFYNARPAQYATDEDAEESHLCLQWVEQYIRRIDGPDPSPDEDK